MNLTEELLEKKASSLNVIPAEKRTIMEKSTNQLKTKGLSAQALKTGQVLPSFSLKNTHGDTVSLADFESEYLIVSFYRGGWCPYCNMELKALQAILPDLKALHAELIAITPETPDNSLTTSEKNGIQFSILSDINNTFAKQLGLAFQLPEDLQSVYKEFGIEVDKHNANENFELPMPATYIVNKQREVMYSFVPEDYTERLDPETIIDFLKENQK